MKGISKYSAFVLGLIRVVLFLCLSVVFIREKNMLVAAFCLILSLSALVVLAILMNYIADRKVKIWVAFLTTIFVSAISGATYFLWNPNSPKEIEKEKAKRKSNKNYLITKKERNILTIIFVVLFIYALTLIYPFLYLLLNSFKTFADFSNNPIWFSPHATINNYIAVFTTFKAETLDGSVGILGMFWNSLSLSVVETVVSMFLTCCAAYVLAKYKFVGNKFIYTFVIVCSVVPAIAAITATYKLMVDTRLMGTFIGMIMMECGAFGGGFLYIHSYFKSIPWSFAESAMMDGASDFKIFYRIMMPMAKNGILTFTILRFL